MLLYRNKANTNDIIRAQEVTKSIANTLSKLANGYDRRSDVDENGRLYIIITDASANQTKAYEGDFVCTKDYSKFTVMSGDSFNDLYEEVTEE